MNNTEQAIQYQADTDRYQQIVSDEDRGVESSDVNLFSIVVLLCCISLILSLCLYYGYKVYSQLIGANDVGIIYNVLGT